MLNPIFNHPQRDQLFRSMQFWFDLCPIDSTTGLPLTEQQKPYALYYCHPVGSETIQLIQHASEAVGRILMKFWFVLRTLNDSVLLDYGFPAATVRVIKHDPLPPFCMRLDWCWNEATGTTKVIETNAQTPSFWFECTEGNRKVAEHFGWHDPTPAAQSQLKLSLNRYLQRAAAHRKKPLHDCRVAFSAHNTAEDMGTMRWLSQQFDGESFVLPLEHLQLYPGDCLVDDRTQAPIDILFLWYPLEWAIHDVDQAGEPLWTELEALILQQKVVIVNFASAFLLQPKSVFALLTEFGDQVFDREDAAVLSNFFPKTSLTRCELGDTYFAKPILGRQGEGGFAVKGGAVISRSHNNDPWYTQQPYVYQELLEFPQVSVAGSSMPALWGAWLYNNGEEQLVAGGVGMRVSEGTITDDNSYWCPIGVAE